MESIYHQSPPLSGLAKLKHKQLLHCFSRQSIPGGVLQRCNFYLPNPVRTKAMAITSSRLVVLDVNSPAAAATSTTTADFNVLILTSAAFLFLYWIANFVVPEFIMKDLQSDDASKDEEGGMPLSKTISSEQEKKGFQGTK